MDKTIYDKAIGYFYSVLHFLTSQENDKYSVNFLWLDRE